MKSKHNELKENRFDTLDFANLYKSAAETNVKLLEIDTVAEKKRKKKKSINSKNIVLKESKNVKKYKNNDYSHENKTGLKDYQALTIRPKKINRHESDFSQPLVSNLPTETKINEHISSSIKKRAKNKHSLIPVADINNTDNTTNIQNIEKKSKPKKRNKSVSVMVDDNEVAIKKSKSNDIVSTSETLIKPRKSKKKTKCLENKLGDDSSIKIDIKADAENKENKLKTDTETNANVDSNRAIIKKKSRKKSKKHNNNEIATSGENEEVENNPSQKVHIKKSKKIKYNSQLNEGFDKADGEPVIKSRKKGDKSGVISDLKNLKIGDNTHSLTNLLDEMSVVDQKKKKRNKSKKKHEEQQNAENTKSELETSPEKEKWNKRKWNKEKKGEYDQKKGLTCVIVENLPINIILNYKKLLTEHFSKFGVVKRVGIAQVYPTEDPKPVFTTMVHFESEDDAKKVLQEDNTRFEGNVIRIKESLPPTQTIAVVHSYGELSDQIISSIFSEAGRIRRIRQKVKGKKCRATAFVEFDGPDAVERAIKKAEETKVGGKNIHVSKYQLKPKKNKKKTLVTENQAESDVSND